MFGQLEHAYPISNVQLVKVNPKIQSGIWGLIMLHQLQKILNVNGAWSLDKNLTSCCQVW